MADPIAELIGISPMDQETIDWINDEVAQIKKMSAPRRWGGSITSPGRTKGSKNIELYPITDKVKDRFKRHSKVMSERNAGKVWVTNGTQNKFVLIEQMPAGWRKGRVMKKRKHGTQR